MTLSKITNNNETNLTWRTVVDAGIDQINANTTAIATNATNITSNDTDIATNVTNIATNATNIATNVTNIATNATNIASNDTDIATNVTNIATNTSDINTHILKSGVTITITATGSTSSDVSAVVEGGITGTYTGTSAVQNAIDSIPENLSGNNVLIVVGDDGTGSGQTIPVINTISVNNFYGGVITIKSAKANDNDGTTAATTVRHNTISTTNADNSISALFSISNNSEVRIQGLNLKQTFSTQTSSQVINFSGQSVYTLEHCHISMGNTDVNKGTRGVLSWRSSRGFIESVYFDNCRTMIFSHKNSSVDIVSAAWVGTGTQPIYGVSASGGIAFLPHTDQAQPVGTVATNLVTSGGLITNEKGLIVDETILTADTTVTITQSGGESTTQCVVTGYTSATFNASDYNNDAQDTIQAAINSLPKNINGYDIRFIFGTLSGQTITISDDIQILDFTGGSFLIMSGKADDRDDNGFTKANKIQSSGTSIDRIFEIGRCSEVYIQGLELRQTTGTGDGFVVVASSSWVDVNHSVLTADYSTHQATQATMRGLLSQRGSTSWFRDSWVNNVSVGVFAANMATAGQTNASWTGTQPVTGMQVQAGIGISDSTIIEGSSADYLVSKGGLITNKNGLILEETILTGAKTVTIAAGSTYAEIQTLINAQPKNLNGHTLTVKFTSGTTSSPEVYDFGSEDLNIRGFHGGTLTVEGVADESSTATGTVYKTKIRSTRDNWQGLFNIDDCNRVEIKSLQLDLYGTTTGQAAVRTQNSDVNVFNCRFTYSGTGTPNVTNLYVVGVNPLNSSCEVVNNQFDKMSFCLFAERGSKVFADNSVSFGTTPLRGYQASKGAIITPDGTVPNANVIYVASEGGLITAKSGMILDETILTASKTVNLDNSMSVTEIQNIINDQPKQLNGNSLIFQFADGDYDFIAGGISFNGFDGGYLDVRGNLNNTDVENLSVKFHGEQGSSNGLVVFVNCSARCQMIKIALEQDSTSVTDQRLLRFISVAHGLVNSCSFNSLSTNRANEGIFVNDGRTRINSCKFNNLEKAIYSSQNSTHSYNNSELSGGTAPDSGLVGIDGAIITQQGTQINAHTNDTSKANGAVIFNSSGALV